MDIHALAKRLRLVPLPDYDGPSSAAALEGLEKRIGRTLVPTHRRLLSELGGCLGFDDGYVYVGEHDLDVSEFLGASSSDFGIADWWEGYAGQIPDGWYPFAKDVEGNVFRISCGFSGSSTAGSGVQERCGCSIRRAWR